ncbi:MAG: hypothetical protein JXR21_06410 [Candidatus Marinimicrobia bacterium]|nr:hypothetical protein [Candidatus Neomarinimicrobiota bacterium]
MGHLFNLIIQNGVILLIPVFIWNFLLASKLPPAYGPVHFDEGIPKPLLVAEGGFRMIVFLLPLLFRIDPSGQSGKAGLLVYAAGVLLYFASWLALICLPERIWRKRVLLFTAPAVTPLIWFTGIGLMADAYYFNLPFRLWHYLLPCIVFTAIHVAHSLLAFRKTSL